MVFGLPWYMFRGGDVVTLEAVFPSHNKFEHSFLFPLFNTVVRHSVIAGMNRNSIAGIIIRRAPCV